MEQQLATGIITLFLIGLTGYFIQSRGHLGVDGRESIVRVVMLVCFPCMSFHSMATKIEPEAIYANLITVGMAFGMIALGCALGYLAVLPTKLVDPARKTFIHLCACNNYIFMPLPIVHFLWPQNDGVLFLVMLGAGLAYWIVGVYPLVRGHHPIQQVKHIFNLPLMATIAGLFVAMIGWKPVFEETLFLNSFFEATRLLGTPTAPLAIFLVGAGLAHKAEKASPYIMIWYSAVRLLIFPMLFIIPLVFSGLDTPVMRILLLVSMMPASNTSTMIAQRFGGDPQLASSANLYSTILAGITIPFLHPVFSHLMTWLQTCAS